MGRELKRKQAKREGKNVKELQVKKQDFNTMKPKTLVIIVAVILVLFIGTPINNAKCWFIIPYIGSFQPSEFMKIFLIITLSRMIGDFNAERRSNDMMEEFKFLIKVLIVVGIPSVLTFIEPDTGAVLIYFIIIPIISCRIFLFFHSTWNKYNHTLSCSSQ